MKQIPWLVLTVFALTGCSRPADAQKGSLADARRGFQTRLVQQLKDTDPLPEPPAQLFRTVRVRFARGQTGRLPQSLARRWQEAPGHPVDLRGRLSNSIGETAWKEQPPDNDQSASAFRKAGVVMMYPSFRGGNGNPGVSEGFFGEVDDLLAAADYLAKQDFVDPDRIYLGGHSTGGTLVLLAAESSDRFRAVFSFGPADDVAGYGPKELPFDLSNAREVELRSPGRWLHSIRTPVFVFEGDREGNVDSLRVLARANNPLVHCYTVRGASHFSTLAPVTRLIASQVRADEGPKTNIAFTEKELNDLFAK